MVRIKHRMSERSLFESATYSINPPSIRIELTQGGIYLKKLAVLLLSLLLLSACGEGELKGTPSPQHQAGAGNQEPEPSPTSALKEEELVLSTKVTEGDFELALYTSKTHYAVDETIKVYAELTYTGEQEQIEIGHSMYPVGFTIEEHTRDMSIPGFMNEPYIVTTLKKDEPVKYEYSFSGGYSEQDGEDYIAFVKELMDEQFPEGQYTIAAHASFVEHAAHDGADGKPSYQFSNSISFVVE